MVRPSIDLNGSVYLDKYKKNIVNTQHKKNRITIVVIFAMSIIPFGIAWFLAANPEQVKLGTNNGDLISPPLVTEINQFSGYDEFSAANLKELQGHWVMISLVPETCGDVCQDGLYKTRQLSLMMGKDIARIRRLALMPTKKDSILPAQWQDDGRLLKMLAAAPLQEKITQLINLPAQDGALLIMDPLGNLMMKYATGFDPYKVRNDLSKLLRISQIG
jgi:hypothetical protein